MERAHLGEPEDVRDLGDRLVRGSSHRRDPAIAIGDQTNDVNVDSVLRIRSVTKLCL